MPRSRIVLAFSVTLVALVIVAAGTELFVRYVLVPRSRDLSRLPGYDQRAAGLVACHRSIAIVGNSTAELAIDTTIIQDAFRIHGLPAPCIQVFATDGSGMTTWAATLDRYFWSRGRAPGTVVLMGAPYAFDDEGSSLEVGRIAHFLGSGTASPRPELDSLLSPYQRIDYAASAWSAAIAVRRRIAQRLRGPPTPAAASGAASSGPASFRALAQVRAAADRHGLMLLIVTAPERDRYLGIDSGASDLAPVIDLQRAPGLTPSVFRDELHLDPQGRADFSRVLGESLVTRATP